MSLGKSVQLNNNHKIILKVHMFLVSYLHRLCSRPWTRIHPSPLLQQVQLSQLNAQPQSTIITYQRRNKSTGPLTQNPVVQPSSSSLVPPPMATQVDSTSTATPTHHMITRSKTNSLKPKQLHTDLYSFYIKSYMINNNDIILPSSALSLDNSFRREDIVCWAVVKKHMWIGVVKNVKWQKGNFFITWTKK
ncbi:hypothetical protein H5410_001686 [Solanum commersonii]|uniref:Uncharacterized protein n=1 Tax=Solanum commersonii TaxID=4109 RepID=A0A9J6AZV6_SOLCO|nr:hypothetical protein H5410_001686 [Solanum commersonii]